MNPLSIPLLATALVAAPQEPADSGIHWHPTLAAAQAASAEDGKPVLAYFTFET